ncbi:spore maturation protein [Nocardioides mangrovicus]|uniref:Spore maturation protein n=1 Tax=Nocardioides mangrovicus TaxID=2478913 RepID=A0A3L8NYJ1_9ACTN|nr:spore maturation protein [Nocardioides mangrovicus]
MLLVSPRFHGYWRSIAAALSAAGHQVRAHPYDQRSAGALVAHKLGRELPARLAGRPATGAEGTLTRRAVALLRESRPEAVVVVRGDGLGPAFYEELDAARVPRVLWLYDEVRRTGWSPETLRAVGPVATYSPLDAAALGLRYLPLAFDPAVADLHQVARTDDVVFIGARYLSREEVLVGLQAAGVPVRAFGRDWSRHLLDRARTWGGARPGVPSGRDVSRAEGYRLMAGAGGALNLHGDQDGFTMRTFEASGVGGLQLLDRDDVGELYEPGVELLTFTGVEELVDLVRRARHEPGWAETVRARGRERTLAEHTFAHRVGVLEELWSTWG